MFSTRTVITVALPAVLLVALTGCFGGSGSGTDTGTGTGTDSGAGAGGSTTECIAGKTWRLDTNDAAMQLAEQLSSGGLNVTQSVAEGVHTFEFSESGEATTSIDVTYTLTVDSGDGIVITLVQTHSGTPSGEWAWLGDSETVTFTNWDNAGYSVQNTVLVNGTASESPIVIPSDDLGGTDMETECSGSTLSTHVASSPFTQHWSSEG